MFVVFMVDSPGNTSACAEKTFVKNYLEENGWKHLRLRGENRSLERLSLDCRETPPLARRKLGLSKQIPFPGGNTSACAEKTESNLFKFRRNQKHLRLRGENLRKVVLRLFQVETPPLARRKRR